MEDGVLLCLRVLDRKPCRSRKGPFFLLILMKLVIFVQRVCPFLLLVLLPFTIFIYLFFFLFFFFFFLAVKRPSLSKFNLDRVQQACSFADRTFHSLVTIRRLASWGLGPEPTKEALAHKLTTRRRKLSLLSLS